MSGMVLLEWADELSWRGGHFCSFFRPFCVWLPGEGQETGMVVVMGEVSRCGQERRDFLARVRMRATLLA